MRKTLSVLFLLFTSLILSASGVILSGAEFSFDGNFASYDGEALVWEKYSGEVYRDFEVEESGEYCIEIEYTAAKGKGDEIILSVSVDDREYDVTLERCYSYGPVRYDENGNGVRSLTEVSSDVLRERLRVKDNMTPDYISIYLKKGSHTVRIEGKRTAFTLRKLSFLSDEVVSTKAETVDSDSKIRVEAEDIYRTSSTVLTAQYDRSDASVSPSDPSRSLLNIAGGSSWSRDGNWMEWKVNTEEEGTYRLALKYRQNFKQGMTVMRRLYVDGTVVEDLTFIWSNSWKLCESGNFYLSEGEHVIRLEVVPGKYSDIFREISAAVDELNTIYRRIIMVTGTSPDSNREYKLEEQIEGLTDSLSSLSSSLAASRDSLRMLVESDSISYSAIEVLISQLDSFVDEPESIAARISTFRSNISSLSSWLYTNLEAPLDLDWMELLGTEAVASSINASFLENITYGFRNFIHSFSSESEEDADVTVWISVGRDQLQIIKELIQEYFTPETGIKVKINLVQTGIEQAVLAGNGPDVVLFLGNTVPVTLAMRDALYALDSFSDFEKKTEIYDDESFIPYTYKGHIYAVPFTETFPVMFYRTDIFEEMGLTVPTTWEEFKRLIPVIERKNMYVGLPSSFSMYASILYQYGGALYNDDGSATLLRSEEAIEAFSLYTSFFSDYGLALSYDFFNRFRSGELPLGIADYTEYGKLSYAASELDGLWKMAVIPSTEDDGSVALSGSTCGVILKSAENVDYAWQFLSWFSSEDIQIKYGTQLEALLGASGRYASAADSVISELAWLDEEYEILKASRENLVRIEQFPGSYYMQRNVISAFRNVINNGENPREMLERYSRTIDRELERKQNETGGDV